VVSRARLIARGGLQHLLQADSAEAHLAMAAALSVAGEAGTAIKGMRYMRCVVRKP